MLNILYFHGFLGRPNDFQSVVISNTSSNPNPSTHNTVLVDYFHIPELNPTVPLLNWGQQFWQWYQHHYGQAPCVLVGYSLGGRLVLEALKNKQNPPDYNRSEDRAQGNGLKACIFIAAGFGMKSAGSDLQLDPAIQSRRANDHKWSEKFLSQKFSSVVNEWNQQSVFAGSQIEPERVESDYDRKLLSLALTQWSQVEQENSVEFLLQDPIPKLWVVGQNDKKYFEQSQQLQASSNIENIVIPNSGHRVILDQPQLLKQQIQLFLEKIHLL